MKRIFALLPLLFLQGCEKKSTNNAPLTPSPLVMVQAPSAQEVAHEGEHAQHNHGAHAHGAAKMQIVLENGQLIVNLSMPSADAVGFEHAPSSDAERAQLTAALNPLQAPDSLFILGPKAGCSLKHGSVETALLNPQRASAEHSDIDVHYQWNCTNPSQIDTITINLFSYFNSLEKITAEYSVNAKQGRIELTNKGTNQIRF